MRSATPSCRSRLISNCCRKSSRTRNSANRWIPRWLKASNASHGFGQQCCFWRRTAYISAEPIPVAKLIEDAFREAQKQHGEQPVFLQYETGGQPLMLAGDRAGLKARLLSEPVPGTRFRQTRLTPKVKVSTREDADSHGDHWVHIEVQDSGTGFTSEASRKAPEPFFTTRNV